MAVPDGVAEYLFLGLCSAKASPAHPDDDCEQSHDDSHPTFEPEIEHRGKNDQGNEQWNCDEQKAPGSTPITVELRDNVFVQCVPVVL